MDRVRKSKFSYLVKDKKKGSLKKPKKTVRKQLNKLMYFYMDGCGFCNKMKDMLADEIQNGIHNEIHLEII